MTTKTDRLSTIMAEAAAALRVDGDRLTIRAADWQRGPAAANLDPDRGGWRYQPCGDADCVTCPHPVPSDPTGEAVLRPDVASRYFGEVSSLLVALEASTRRLLALHGLLLPVQPQKANTLKAAHAAGADAALAGWCRSCWRDDQCCQPIEARADGTPYFKDRCRWCGTFYEANDHVDPPLDILRMHHEGRRISERDIARSLARRGGKAA